jgi:hypothetical protein
MSITGDRYATVAQVQQYAPYSTQEFTDAVVNDLIESATREVVKLTRREWDPIADVDDYNDIEIIVSYLTGAMIQVSRGNQSGGEGLRSMALSKLRSLMSGGTGEAGGGATDTINVYSLPRSYHLAKTLDPTQTRITPYKSRY